MNMIKKWTFRMLMLGALLAGCAVHDKIIAPNDEVLIYNLPYDLTYLRTMEALENVPGWEIEETEKEKGIITVRNLQFSRIDDADMRLVRVQVLRDSRYQTSVMIMKDSQRVMGGAKLLETVSTYLSREL